MMKKGDYLFIQFGHNDQKDKSPNAGPFTTYSANLKRFIEAARSKGGIPVLVTPMERRRFNGNDPEPTLADYAKAVRQVGARGKGAGDRSQCDELEVLCRNRAPRSPRGLCVTIPPTLSPARIRN